MFDVPSDHTIDKVIIDEDVVEGKSKPKFLFDETREPVVISIEGKSFNGSGSKNNVS